MVTHFTLIQFNFPIFTTIYLNVSAIIVNISPFRPSVVYMRRRHCESYGEIWTLTNIYSYFVVCIVMQTNKSFIETMKLSVRETLSQGEGAGPILMRFVHHTLTTQTFPVLILNITQQFSKTKFEVEWRSLLKIFAFPFVTPEYNYKVDRIFTSKFVVENVTYIRQNKDLKYRVRLYVYVFLMKIMLSLALASLGDV